jgi:ribonuclease P protein component
MTMPINRYKLPKALLLSGKKNIETLFQHGEAFFVYPFRVVFKIQEFNSSTETEQNNSKFCFAVAVPKKKFKLAVHRNKLKRLTKENFRLQQHIIHSALENKNIQVHALFIYTHTALLGYADIEKSMHKILKKLNESIEQHH